MHMPPRPPRQTSSATPPVQAVSQLEKALNYAVYIFPLYPGCITIPEKGGGSFFDVPELCKSLLGPRKFNFVIPDISELINEAIIGKT